MRITHVLKTTAHGGLSYTDLTSGVHKITEDQQVVARGVTGSEQAMLYLAKAQAAAGHTVVIYMPSRNPGIQHGVEVIDLDKVWPRMRRLDNSDVVISWISSDALRQASPKALRIHSIQVNDWAMNAGGFNEFVDAYVCVTKAHQQHLWERAAGAPGATEKIEIIPNGIDMSRFQGPPVTRIPRRCVYLSSPDRGLHWVLSMWPEIRFAFPDAEFHVFYEVQQWLNSTILLVNEVGQRANYVISKLNSLQSHGAGLRGARPPAELAMELRRADFMLYPCDPIRFTEGFGVAVLDALAAGVQPIITDADALGEVYGSSGAVVVPRGEVGWQDRYLDAVMTHLRQGVSDEQRKALTEWAWQYDWSLIAKQWEEMIQRRMGMK